MKPTFYKVDDEHYHNSEGCYNSDGTCYCGECYIYGERYTNCALAGYAEGPLFVIENGHFVLADNANIN